MIIQKKLKNKNAISEETYNSKPVDSKPRTPYGSAKVHKPLKNGLPLFRPIISAIGTPTYKLAKFLVPILSDITQNEFKTAIVSCSRFIWITNSIDHRRI